MIPWKCVVIPMPNFHTIYINLRNIGLTFAKKVPHLTGFQQFGPQKSWSLVVFAKWSSHHVKSYGRVHTDRESQGKSGKVREIDLGQGKSGKLGKNVKKSGKSQGNYMITRLQPLSYPLIHPHNSNCHKQIFEIFKCIIPYFSKTSQFVS